MKPRVWLGVAAAGWAVALVAAGSWSALHGRPTVREQTTIVRALPVVDGALAAVVAAAQGPQVVFAVAGYERTRSSCEVGNRTGERYQRVLTLFTAAGGEAALIDRVAAGLPAGYGAVVRHLGDTHALRADAGYYVRLTGAGSVPGQLRFTADTGCRVPGGTVPTGASSGGDGGAADPAVDAALAKLGSTASGRTASELRCRSGGLLRTVAVTASRPATALPTGVPDGTTPLLSRERVVAYVAGGTGLALQVRDDDLLLTATTGCQ